MNNYATKKFLLNAGISPDFNGYHYLAEAIGTTKENLKNGKYDYKIMTLYKNVADKFNTTSVRAERSMRHAIGRAFEKNNPILKEMFSSLIDAESGKVNVSCFVFTVAEHLIMEEGS